MTVDRTHVLATPGLDAHGSYVALSRHRDRMDLHYGRDDFADRDRLVRTLSRDRAKDMALDYEQVDPARRYAERRGITFRERVVEIARKVPETVLGLFDGLRLSPASVLGTCEAEGAEREEGTREVRRGPPEPERTAPDDPEVALRRARTRALVRYAKAVDAIFAAQDIGGKASPEQVTELNRSRDGFEAVRPHGWRDAEAAYKKNPELASEAAGGKVIRAIQALQLESEIRTERSLDPRTRADRFVERWHKLDQTRQRQYQAGDMAAYQSTRTTMADMAKGLERDPQIESVLRNRKRELGIGIESSGSVGDDLALGYGLGRGRGRGIGI